MKCHAHWTATWLSLAVVMAVLTGKESLILSFSDFQRIKNRGKGGYRLLDEKSGSLLVYPAFAVNIFWEVGHSSSAALHGFMIM